jgi:hypothetical protein
MIEPDLIFSKTVYAVLERVNQIYEPLIILQLIFNYLASSFLLKHAS